MNYDKEMIKILENLDYRPSILMHSCCGPCSTAVIERLTKYLDITVIYYNPNIEPKDEYEKRKYEQLKVVKRLGIKFLDCDYDNETFKEMARGLENDKEGGRRCHKCYLLRLEYVAKIACDLGFDYFSTTLSVSPYKNAEVLNKIGLNLERKYLVKYLVNDFKKRDGYKRSIELSREFDLYRQDYCGCLYSLEYTRKEDNNE